LDPAGVHLKPAEALVDPPPMPGGAPPWIPGGDSHPLVDPPPIPEGAPPWAGPIPEGGSHPLVGIPPIPGGSIANEPIPEKVATSMSQSSASWAALWRYEGHARVGDIYIYIYIYIYIHK